MAELKTKPSKLSVAKFLGAIEDDTKRRDCRWLQKVMKELTGETPKMWGGAIVGFGSYNYKYPSGRTGQWFLTGFSPRKQALTLYIMDGFDRHADLMARLGKHKTGKCCLYIKRLADVDTDVLRQLISESIEHPPYAV